MTNHMQFLLRILNKKQPREVNVLKPWA